MRALLRSSSRLAGIVIPAMSLAALLGCGGDSSSSNDTPDSGGGDAADSTTDGTSGDGLGDAPTDSGTDSGANDAQTDAPTDTGTSDTPASDTPPSDGGSCKATTDKCGDATLSCLCCPGGGTMIKCTCSTACDTSADCKDPARPFCDRWTGSSTKGICTTTEFKCCWGCK